MSTGDEERLTPLGAEVNDQDRLSRASWFRLARMSSSDRIVVDAQVRFGKPCSTRHPNQRGRCAGLPGRWNERRPDPAGLPAAGTRGYPRLPGIRC